MSKIDFTKAVDADAKRAALRTAAQARIAAEHAAVMRVLTGNATIEERDTWKTKEDAARAFLYGAATAGQQAMLELEAEGRGEEVQALASAIVAKADSFARLIGLASKLRAEARAAVDQATDAAVPLSGVPAGIDAVFSSLSDQVAAAIADWQASS